MVEEELQRIRMSDTPWLAHPMIKDSYFRVLRVDDVANLVVMNVRMPPHTVTPAHEHHCAAVAYTLSGEWFYGNNSFKEGEMAFETAADEIHQPITKEKPAELLTMLFAGKGNDKFLENHNDDGSRTLIRTRYFKALERISPAEFAKLDIAALLA